MGFYGNIFLESEEIINEKTIFTSPELSIAVNPDQTKSISFVADPYFKVYNGGSFSSSTKIARISIKDPHYIYHKNNGNKKQWILNTNERKILNNILLSVIGTKTVYDLLLDDIYNYCGVRPKIPLPDFSYIRK